MSRVLATGWRRAAVTAGALAIVAAGLIAQRSSSGDPQRAVASGPNVVVILLDDLRSSDLAHMPRVRNTLARRGVTFPRFTTTVPTCCPSRASFLRGQYAHNHGVGYDQPPREEVFHEQGLDRSTIGVWMWEAGYRTGYVGKYLNSYEARRVPPGWDRWAANLNRTIWARTLNVNGSPRTIDGGSVDAHLGRIGTRFAVNSKRPFFLFQNFNAPHVIDGGPRVPAPRRDRKRFRGVRAPHTGSFNRVRRGMPAFVRDRPRLRPAQRRRLNLEQRGRLASLQVVDRQVKRLVNALRRSGELASTYILLTSDNGYHMGERRLAAGKLTPLLTDVRVPLIVRGPGIEPGTRRPELLQNTDLAPTVAELGGASTPGFVDGRSFAPLLAGERPAWREASFFEAREPRPDRPRPEVRFVGATTSDGHHYIRYPNGFDELYDLGADPAQLSSLADRPGQARRVAELSARVEAFSTCAGPECAEVEDGP